MRVMVFVKATEDSEAGRMPTTELFEAMGKFNEELVDRRHHAGRRRAEALVAGQARRLRRPEPHRHRRARSPRPASSSPATGSGRSRTWPRRSSG